jgi:hypothetical protein
MSCVLRGTASRLIDRAPARPDTGRPGPIPKAESRAEMESGVRHPLGMTHGIWVPRLRGCCERENELFGIQMNW